PAVLGQICRKWREIAFDTPRLWRTIALDLWDRDSFEVLKTWLSRSKGCSLSLLLDRPYNPRLSELRHFTDIIISHSGRWEYIQLNFTLHQSSWIEGQGPFPLLCHLTIRFSAPEMEPTSGVQTLFDEAPHLTSVVLGEYFDPSVVGLPWPQFTSITSENIRPAVAADILREATVLVNFRCSVWDIGGVPLSVPPLVHLESFIGIGDNSFHESQKVLLDALTTPALRHLSISER
ncbi:hypothetical protein C8J57DRAFT_1074416, partial [Mycena rebaudengoi]